MDVKLREAFDTEIKKAKAAYFNQDDSLAFHHLERAHILGQSFVIPHTTSHWWMLKIGVRTNNSQEIFGQLTRIVASLVFSKIWVPIGNTGGANVNPVKTMPVPKDLKKVLKIKN